MRTSFARLLSALLFVSLTNACGNAVMGQDSGISTPDTTCIAPPSCDGPQRCTGMLTYEVVESRPCAEVCGTSPCVGSTCVAVSGQRMCPAGMRCVAYRINDPRGFMSPTPCMLPTATDGG